MIGELAVRRDEIAVAAAGQAQASHLVAVLATGEIQNRRGGHGQLVGQGAAEGVDEEHQVPGGDICSHSGRG